MLTVRDLRVTFPLDGTPGVRAVDGVSFGLERGGALGIVGETGAGKTTIARALLGLHPPEWVQGSIRLDGQELVGLSEEAWRPLRWRRIALVVQSVGTALDPVYRVGEQIAEPMRVHLGLSPAGAWSRAEELARQVGLEPRHLRAYPHQLSGGEKQRALLAMALSCEPDVLILDEPTSGQDMLSRARLLALLETVRRERGAGLLLISHDLGAVARLTEQVAVLYAGKVVELGPTAAVFGDPRHPYTWGLVHSYPDMSTARDLRNIRGHPPDPVRPPSGCRFHPRCTQAVERCRHEEPLLVEVNGRWIACHLGGLQTLLRAEGLRKIFFVNHGGPHERLEAVREVSLEIREGEVVALVGETGSGKTTLGRMLVGLLSPDGGRVVLEGRDLTAARGEERRRLARRVQFIPQDPFDAVNPRLTVAQAVREPLDIQKIGTPPEREEKVRRVLEAVGLPTDPSFLARRAHELSGGQLQRVVIARALVLEPKLLVADEPVAMLDPSEQARLLNLLKEIQVERGLALLLISHDLALVRKVADRILVMHRGRIVEEGPGSQIIAHPAHEHTRALLASAPRLLLSGAQMHADSRG
ncbi:MAG: ABC transporter ATP-binding protein [Thermoflexia bacterium]|nr:MAG: ABC transporter ATP-binding protein [Thermoflexia bacterium]